MVTGWEEKAAVWRERDQQNKLNARRTGDRQIVIARRIAPPDPQCVRQSLCRATERLSLRGALRRSNLVKSEIASLATTSKSWSLDDFWYHLNKPGKE